MDDNVEQTTFLSFDFNLEKRRKKKSNKNKKFHKKKIHNFSTKAFIHGKEIKIQDKEKEKVPRIS